MSFNLGSERVSVDSIAKRCLVPMSFNLGSELFPKFFLNDFSLVPMSFNLGSEPLFSNLYLIVT